MFDKFERITSLNERRRLHCNECERITIHTLEARCRGTWDDENHPVFGGTEFSTLRCGACDSVCYESASWNSESYFHDDEGNLVADVDRVQYPIPVGKDFTFDRDYTPSGLDILLDEMLYSYGGGRSTLATVGLRMVVEYLAKDADCRGRNLEKRIDALRDKGLIDEEQHDLFQKIRERGNASAHEAKAMSQDELVAGMDVVNVLIEKLYTNPGKTKNAIARAKRVLGPQVEAPQNPFNTAPF